jgi:hypothetical protein
VTGDGGPGMASRGCTGREVSLDELKKQSGAEGTTRHRRYLLGRVAQQVEGHRLIDGIPLLSRKDVNLA